MKIIIAGAGFAGFAAANAIERVEGNEYLLIDRNEYTTMIPSLPYYAAERLPVEMVYGDIRSRIPEWIDFINEEVESYDFKNMKVVTNREQYDYDFLVIATGSKTNFYGFNENTDKIYRLDSLETSGRIREELPEYLRNFPDGNIIFAGGGYTGIELACILRDFAVECGANPDITIVEVKDDILPFLDADQKEYVKSYLKYKDIDVYYRRKLTGYDGKTAVINGRQKIENPFIIWTAGLKSSVDDIKGNIDMQDDGRVNVDKFLQVPQISRVFAVGDAAAISKEGEILRRAVNFAVSSGKQAGKNISRIFEGKEIEEFHPVDPGWIIPLNGVSVGKLFGRIPVKGKLGLRLHFLVSGYRSYNLKNKAKYFKKAVTA